MPVVHGSAIRPVGFVINASALKVVSDGNTLFKYADDTYFVVPSINSSTPSAELCNIEQWAVNNLRLNRSKSLERDSSTSKSARRACLQT